MHTEIEIAAKFIASYLPIEEQQEYIEHLVKMLVARISGHWYPSMPIRGSAYRSIKLLHKLDSILLFGNFSVHLLPRDCVVFIDPYSVSFRMGSNYIISLYDGNLSEGKQSFTSDRSRVTIKRPPLSPPKQNASHRYSLPTIYVA
jgi:hypothetical protein